MNTVYYGIAGFALVIITAFLLTNYKTLLGKWGKKTTHLKK
jgi:hypothetical protein